MTKEGLIYNNEASLTYIYHWEVGSPVPPMPKYKRSISIKKWTDGECRKIKILPLYVGFDIETTNVIEGEEKSAYMYHWQFALGSEAFTIIFLGRTWDAFMDLMDVITNELHLSRDTQLIVWDANLGFEYEFLMHRFRWIPEDFFAREERHPLSATTTSGLSFREALSISGGNLAQLAKDYTHTQKLVGDLDYDIQRSSKTPLTEQEEEYCINDVAILAEWSAFIFHKYIIPDRKIPLTKTGLLRSEVKAEFKNLFTFPQQVKYKELIQEAFPDMQTYEYWFKYLFRGGYVHSNIINTGIMLRDMLHKDETSAYPTWMNLGYYPISKFAPKYDTENIEKYITEKCCIITCEFSKIERRYSISYESKHKCIELEGALLDNGRIAKASYMKVCLTELDFKIYKKLYKWEECSIRCLWVADRGKLPPFILNVLNNHYRRKSELKMAGLNKTPEYAIEKSGVNACFGMMCTRLQLDKVTINERGDWMIAEQALEYEKEISKQILLPQWGIWVCAWGRYALMIPAFEILEKVGPEAIAYNDTDSHIVKNLPEVNEIFEKYNLWVRKKIKAAGLTDPVFDGLGEFMTEAIHDKFKTLGSKRYLCEDGGVVEATIAGLPKSSILNIEGDPFEAFSEYGMKLSAEYSNKRSIHYEDGPTDWLAPDGVLMHEESSACIFEIKFSMTLDKFYRSLVETTIKREKERKVYGD